jgi:hypothetical protein
MTHLNGYGDLILSDNKLGPQLPAANTADSIELASSQFLTPRFFLS